MVACRRCDALDFFNEKRGKRASPVERGGRAGRLARGAIRAAQVCRIRPDPPKRGGGTREHAGGCRGPHRRSPRPVEPPVVDIQHLTELIHY